MCWLLGAGVPAPGRRNRAFCDHDSPPGAQDEGPAGPGVYLFALDCEGAVACRAQPSGPSGPEALCAPARPRRRDALFFVPSYGAFKAAFVASAARLKTVRTGVSTAKDCF